MMGEGNGRKVELFGWAADMVQGAVTKRRLANQESS
jgi:hypothetical protein